MHREYRSASSSQTQFVVLGGGIIGLSCAIRLMEKYPNASLEIISDVFSPHTTSDIAAGLWGPYVLGSTCETACRKWAQDTHNYLLKIWRHGLAAKCGICLVPVLEIFKTEEPRPWWHDIVFGFQTFDVQAGQMKHLELTLNLQMYQTGVAYVTFTCEPTKLMQYYREILLSQNVKFRKERLDTIYSLSKLNINANAVIINCLGLGAQEITYDTELSPIRGQVQKLRATGVFQCFAYDDYYIIPNTDSVTLGGTKQKSYNLRVCPLDRYIIKKKCVDIIPSLQHALLEKDVVGLRPLRSTGVRLEIEYASIFDGPNGRQSLIVHNYGHGGAGITLGWGCAEEVVQLIEREMNDARSKL